MSEEEFYALHLKMDDSILITDIHGTVYARELDNEKLGSNYDYRMHYFFFEKFLCSIKFYLELFLKHVNC